VSTQFAVDEKIVHPHHGTGQITGVEDLELLAGYRHYYVIDFPAQSLTVRVPVRKAGELGLRPVMAAAEIAEVFNTLRRPPGPLPEDYKERHAQVREQLKSSDPQTVAAVVRDLHWHGRLDHLTRIDEELLSEGRDILAGEIAFATAADLAETQLRIDAALATSQATQVPATPT
jgi:CarD family transcriptional regulator